MRNLYKILGLAPEASMEQIQKRLYIVNDVNTKKDIIATLLNDGNRKRYDELHILLVNINSLRTNLGLDHAPNWDEYIANEYHDKSIRPKLKHIEFKTKVALKAKKSNSKTQNQPEFTEEDKLTKEQNRHFRKILFSIIFTILLIVTLIVIFDQIPKKIHSTKTSNNSVQLTKPYHGSVRTNIYTERIAPFEIKTESGEDYLVKLENIYDKSKYFSIFITGGRAITTDVPLGTYSLKYASGTKWYGYKNLFGRDGYYNKSQESFDFLFNGYTVTLYRVSSGNMRTKRIKQNQF